MSKLDDILEIVRSNAMRKEEKKTCPVVWILAVVGAIVAVAAIAYAVYRYFQGEVTDDFDEDFDDDFDDDFFEDEDTEPIVITTQTINETEAVAADAPTAEE